jgi:ribonuclease Z
MSTRSVRCAVAALLLLLAPAVPDAQALEVTLLGTGRPDPAIDRFGPSTLVVAGPEKLLFDVGRGASQRLWQRRIPLGQVSGVFLTHLHSDHVVGFADLWLTGWLPAPFGRRVTPLEVWGPAGTADMMTALRKAYAWDLRVRAEHQALPASGVAIAARDVTQGVVLERNGVKVTAFRVDHGEVLEPALGYRVDHAGRSVVISGDTRFSENLIRFAAGADVLVHEVAAARAELVAASPVTRSILAVHTSPEDAGRVFARVKPRLAVYSHVVLLTTDPKIGAPSVEDLVARTRSSYAGPLVVGEDLMTLVVGDTVEVRRYSPPAR